jgi:NOL1/NOP2/sun family putative RNA methylase
MDTLPDSLCELERLSLRSAIESSELMRAVRLNKIDLSMLIETFSLKYEAVPWAERAYFLPSDHELGKHPLHAAGAYYLQEPSAMAAVGAMEVEQGHRVLDLCAAPGGKSGQISARLNGGGLLVANEPHAQRMRILRGNLIRLGVTNALMLCESAERLAERFPAAFDRVLVDAPCSGEGMFRREATARLQWSEASVKGCAKRQLALLRNAQSMVKPGGLLVYSTCTFNRFENEGVAQAFLDEHPSFAAEDFCLPGLPDSSDGMLRLYPHRRQGEGQFIARFRNHGDGRAQEPRIARSARPALITRRDAEYFESFRQQTLPNWSGGGELMKIGNWLCYINDSFPPPDQIAGLSIKGIGLELGELAADGFIPAKALAMTLRPGSASNCLEITIDEARAWLSGTALRIDSSSSSGWILISYRGLPLGFGFAERGRVRSVSRRSGDPRKRNAWELRHI